MRVSKHGPGRRAVGLRRSPPADKEAKSQRDKGAITRRGKTRSRYSSSQRVAPARPPQLTCCVMCVSRQRRLRRQGGLRLGRARRFTPTTCGFAFCRQRGKDGQLGLRLALPHGNAS